jgi:hypothetical protein
MPFGELSCWQRRLVRLQIPEDSQVRWRFRGWIQGGAQPQQLLGCRARDRRIWLPSGATGTVLLPQQEPHL